MEGERDKWEMQAQLQASAEAQRLGVQQVCSRCQAPSDALGLIRATSIALRPRTRRVSQRQFFPRRQGREEGKKKGGGKEDRGEGKKGEKKSKEGKKERNRLNFQFYGLYI